MKHMKLQTGLVIALLSCLGAGALSAYSFLNPVRKWASLPIHIIVDNRGLTSITDGDLGRTRTRNAITSAAAWNGAGLGTIVTAAVGSVAGSFPNDGRVTINFRDPVGACTGSCIAAVFSSYGGGILTDADIVTNSGLAWASAGGACSNEIYIEGVMVREVGRVLGLGSSTVPGATMYPSFGYCNNGPASIEADDIAGINALY